MWSNSLPVYPEGGESLIPLVILAVAPEYDSPSWVLAREARCGESHTTLSPHLRDVRQCENSEREQRDEHQEAPVMLLNDIPDTARNDHKNHRKRDHAIIVLLATGHRCPRPANTSAAIFLTIIAQRRARQVAAFG
jgi:hypothetical protein